MSNLIQTTKDQTGKEIVMVRVDKTLKEMMEEKPSSRWNIHYWDPGYDNIGETFKKIKWEVKALGEIKEISIHTAYKGVQPKPNKTGSFLYITSKNIDYTGINVVDDIFKISFDSPANTERTRLKEDDVLLVRSGDASLGYITINTSSSLRANIRSEIYIIRVLNKKIINPYYITVYLKSHILGQRQMFRLENGVGTPNLNIEEIKALKIPLIDQNIQEDIESEYKQMSVYHENAMMEKEKGEEDEYKKNLDAAERMLKDLIFKTESVIRGERKDVV